MKHFFSIQLIAIAGFIFLSTDSSLGMFLGLNMKGSIFFRNLCKIQDPTGLINARPLLCSFIHFRNATTTTPKPIFLCTGPNTDKFDCTHYPMGKKCPAIYDFMTGTMEINECELEFPTTTEKPLNPPKPLPLHRRFCRGGPFACDINMKCPPEVSEGKCSALSLS